MLYQPCSKKTNTTYVEIVVLPMKPDLSQEIQQSAECQAGHCRVFGNPQRVLILWLLAEKERTANEIALAIGASLESALHHTHILEFSKLVKSRSEQNNVFYYIADNEMVRNCQVFAGRPKNIMTEVNQL